MCGLKNKHFSVVEAVRLPSWFQLGQNLVESSLPGYVLMWPSLKRTHNVMLCLLLFYNGIDPFRRAPSSWSHLTLTLKVSLPKPTTLGLQHTNLDGGHKHLVHSPWQSLKKCYSQFMCPGKNFPVNLPVKPQRSRYLFLNEKEGKG